MGQFVWMDLFSMGKGNLYVEMLRKRWTMTTSEKGSRIQSSLQEVTARLLTFVMGTEHSTPAMCSESAVSPRTRPCLRSCRSTATSHTRKSSSTGVPPPPYCSSRVPSAHSIIKSGCWTMQCNGLKAESWRCPAPNSQGPHSPTAEEERNHLFLLMFYALLWVENDINKKLSKKLKGISRVKYGRTGLWPQHWGAEAGGPWVWGQPPE